MFFFSLWNFIVNTCEESLNFSYFSSFLATEVVTVFVFQEPSLLSSLQDNGLTDVMLHALLIKDVSPLLLLCKECSVHTPPHNISLPSYLSVQYPGQSFVASTPEHFQRSSDSLDLLSRFLLPVKSLAPSQMYSVHSAWMPEVFSHLYSVSLLNVFSKFFCLQITSQPCEGGGVLILLVSHQDLS